MGAPSKGDAGDQSYFDTRKLLLVTGPYLGHLVSGSLSQLLQSGPLLDSDLEFRMIREQRSGQAACGQLSLDRQHIYGLLALVRDNRTSRVGVGFWNLGT